MKEDIDAYLALRRAVGFRLAVDEYLLRAYSRFASGRDETHVRAQTAMEWAALGPSPQQRERRLRVVARFARHVRAEDARHEVPPVHVFGRLFERRLPHVYSQEEIRQLLDAASRLEPATSLRPHTFRTIFGLLAATGMRVSEALALRFEDVTDDGLVIRETKFKKSRLVPLHLTTAAALSRFLELRRAVGGKDRVFVSLRGKPLHRSTVTQTFLLLARGIGLHPGPGKRGPRVHDLRHSFAVRALENSPEGGNPLGRHMWALSTYLGHVNPANTYWYLQATPRLMRGIADACESFLRGGAR